VLHYREVTEGDVLIGPGYRYTRPLRTILDLIEDGTVERGFIHQAARQAVDGGLITYPQIRGTQMTESGRAVFPHATERPL